MQKQRQLIEGNGDMSIFGRCPVQFWPKYVFVRNLPRFLLLLSFSEEATISKTSGRLISGSVYFSVQTNIGRKWQITLVMTVQHVGTGFLST